MNPPVEELHELALKTIESVLYRNPSNGRGTAGRWFLTFFELNGSTATHIMAHTRAKSMLDPNITKWCTQFPGEEFNNDTVDRWEVFSDTVGYSNEGGSWLCTKVSSIERVVLGDGMEKDRII